MTAPDPLPLLDQLDALRAEPERTCQWCMARPGEWCETDCANPDRHCHPSYVAQFAADRGAYADRDAALIVAAVNALPELTRLAREREALRTAVLALADELDEDQERAYQRSVTGYRIDEFSDGQHHAYEDAAARLRAVVATAIGGDRG